jgi:hypothetical protein
MRGRGAGTLQTWYLWTQDLGLESTPIVEQLCQERGYIVADPNRVRLWQAMQELKAEPLATAGKSRRQSGRHTGLLAGVWASRIWGACGPATLPGLAGV